MLSYQHGYHAGNCADLHKHTVLAELLARLTRKSRGISYLETHAGRGIYDLAAPEAAKTGEAAEGIDRLDPDPATPYGAALSAVRLASGPSAYPGSPSIAQHLLRPQDTMTLMELHPGEHAALRHAMMGTSAAIHRRDGPSGALALAPLKPRKGLVLADPSYELTTEYIAMADFARALIGKWPEATLVIWYPLLPERRHAALLRGLEPLSPVVDEMAIVRPPSRGMIGSGLALINAPFDAAQVLRRAHAQTHPILAPLRVASTGPGFRRD